MLHCLPYCICNSLEEFCTSSSARISSTCVYNCSYCFQLLACRLAAFKCCPLHACSHPANASCFDLPPSSGPFLVHRRGPITVNIFLVYPKTSSKAKAEGMERVFSKHRHEPRRDWRSSPSKAWLATDYVRSFGYFYIRLSRAWSDTSNKPIEWTGHHLLSAAPPKVPFLPLRGSVTTSEGVSRAADIVEQAISTGQPVL